MPSTTAPTSRHARRWNGSSWRIVLGLVTIAAIPVVAGASGREFDATLVFANFLPWLAPWLIVLALARRSGFATLCTAMLQFGLIAVNTIKSQHLGLPLLPTDLAALPNLWHAPKLFLRYLHWHPALLALFVLPPVFILEPPLAALRGRGRAALATVALLFGGSLLARLEPWPSLYGREHLGIPVWLPSEGAREAGFLAQFLQLYTTTRHSVPDVDPDRLAAAEAWLAQYSEPSTSNATDVPDIIIIQSESFFDPGDLAGVDTARYAPRLAELRQRFPHGRLSVPAYGGLTTRTEFEFLTGYWLARTPDLQFPYQALVHQPMRALPWVVREHGLRASAIHPYTRQFYQRDVALPLLGFEQFIDESAFSAADVHGHHVADAALNRRIIATLDDTDRSFVFAISVENHGPWNEHRPVDVRLLPELPANIGLDADANLPLRQYLHHLTRGDQALGELAEWVLQRPRPTVLLFYGDHLPALHQPLESLPWDNGEPAYQQTTPWLLVDNRGIQHGEQVDLAASELAAWLLQRVGIRDASPFARIETLRRAKAAGTLDRIVASDWQREFATIAITDTLQSTVPVYPDGQLGTVQDWSPRSAEVGSADDQNLGFWVRFDAPARPGWTLSLGPEPLEIQAVDGAVLVARLNAEATSRLLAAPGAHALVLTDPARRLRQSLGEFVVRPRAQRLGAIYGFGGGPFCAVTGFGPDVLNMPAAGHTSPAAIWVRAQCLPKSAILTLDGHALTTTVVDDLATAPIPDELLRAPRQARIELRDGDDTLGVGDIAVQNN